MTVFPSHYFAPKSERVKPSQHARITSPTRRLRDLRGRIEPLERLSLGFQIGLGVLAGGVQVNMPEPAPNHRHVDAGSDLVDSRRMPESVWRHTLRRQRRNDYCRSPDILRELEARAGGIKRGAIAIHEQWLSRSARLSSEQGLEQRDRLRPPLARLFTVLQEGRHLGRREVRQGPILFC